MRKSELILRIILLAVTMLLALALLCYACFRYGIDYAISKSWHYTVDCNAPETTYDLYIELPDGNTYQTTLFIC